MRVTAWYDFACPYARIGSLWLRSIAASRDLEIDWRTFCLDQINLDPTANADDLWAAPDARRSLIAAASAQWAAAEGPDVFERVQRAFFEAAHVNKRKIGTSIVVDEVLTELGLPIRSSQLQAGSSWLAAARSQHNEAQSLGVFGVPTFQVGESEPMFVRLTHIPEGDRALEIFDKAFGVVGEPVLNELKRVRTA